LHHTSCTWVRTLLFQKIDDYIDLSTYHHHPWPPNSATKRKAQPYRLRSNPSGKTQAKNATPAEGNTPSGSQTPAEDYPPNLSNHTEDLVPLYNLLEPLSCEETTTTPQKPTEESEQELGHPINEINKFKSTNGMKEARAAL